MIGVCEFAPAFIDTPKGDLDSSDSVEGPDTTVVEDSIVYPLGTSEQFPQMTNSDFGILTQSAHEYAECSNAGICNRTSGVCDCFEGFVGAACQRMTCPGHPVECSGHGTCQTLERIASMDFRSTYQLWSKKSIQGCVCDKGYFGGDCSLRPCKYGLDPLYLDDISTYQIPSYFLTVLTTSDYYDFTDRLSQAEAGYYRLKVYDAYGQGYLTSYIQAGATCDEVLLALENTRIIPPGKTTCFEMTFQDKNPLTKNSAWRIKYDALYQYYFTGIKEYEIDSRPAIDAFGYQNSGAENKSTDALLSGKLYFMQFFGNVGNFQQPEINTHTFDGMQSSLQSRNGKVVARTWTNGMQGFTHDYFTDRCEGVKTQVKQDDGEGFLWGKMFSAENLALCVGQGDVTKRGTKFEPYLVKLVRSQADVRDGGIMAAIYYDEETNFIAGAGERGVAEDGNRGAWRLLNPVYSLDNENALYDVFASHGTLRVTDTRAGAAFSFGANLIHTYNISYDQEGKSYDGDITCDKYVTGPGQSTAKFACLDKNDFFLLLNPYNGPDNPPFLNLYTAKSVRRLDTAKVLGTVQEFDQVESNPAVDPSGVLTSRYLITSDLHVNWASTAVGPSVFHIYKFVPNATFTYEYISQCSNRGVCNNFEGTCECFFGYAGEACQDQNTVLA